MGEPTPNSQAVLEAAAELENKEKLGLFQAEIMRIKSTYPDGTNKDIRNVDDLKAREMDAWQDYKVVLQDFSIKLGDLNNGNFSNRKDIFLPIKDRLNMLVIVVEENDTNISRQKFFEWLRGLVGSISGDITVVLSEKFLLSGVGEIKNDVKEKLDIYVQ